MFKDKAVTEQPKLVDLPAADDVMVNDITNTINDMKQEERSCLHETVCFCVCCHTKCEKCKQNRQNCGDNCCQGSSSNNNNDFWFYYWLYTRDNDDSESCGNCCDSCCESCCEGDDNGCLIDCDD